MVTPLVPARYSGVAVDLAVVIVTHNSKRDTVELLRSLRDDPLYPTWEIVVVDNDSRDGTDAALREEFGEVALVRNTPQRGFAGAANQGFRLTSAPAVAVINPDCVVRPGILEALRQVLIRDERIGAVGPLIRSPSGSVQRHGMFRPTPLTALIVLLRLTEVPLLRREANRYYGDHLRGEPADVDQLTGALLMLRRAALDDVGLFDERFFLYCEDVDWGLRARAAGWRLVFAPEVAVHHAKAVAAKARGAWAIRTYHRSMRAFYLKHHADSPAVLRWLWLAGLRLQEAHSLLRLRLRGEGIRY